MSENFRGDFFDSHCRSVASQLGGFFVFFSPSIMFTVLCLMFLVLSLMVNQIRAY